MYGIRPFSWAMIAMISLGRCTTVSSGWFGVTPTALATAWMYASVSFSSGGAHREMICRMVRSPRFS